MRAAILSVGSELLRGDIVDTNAAFLARELTQLGFEVEDIEQVGDNLAALQAVLERVLAQAALVVSTGGLGPTQDDLTREAIAAALREPISREPGLLQAIEARFASLGRAMPASNAKQAGVIPSAEALANPNGTAPGWFVRKDGRIIVAMPGPPSEMEAMWRDAVWPRLEHLLPGHVAMVALMTFGLGESTVEDRIADLLDRWPHVTIATYAKVNGVQVHITARAATGHEARELAQVAEHNVRERLGQAVFGTDNENLAAVVGRELAHHDLSLAVMESCTGGALASLITNVSGSSCYFHGGIVAYTRAAKERYGVPPALLDQYGLISPETAQAMAQAARRQLDADIGLGVTGVAGAEAVEEKSPGTCFAAVVGVVGEGVREIHRPGPREVVKGFVARSTLDLLRRHLQRFGGNSR